MMRRKPSATSASLGVTRTRLAVEEELGWLFREQSAEDFGIDAMIEVVDDEVVIGKLLALQIKSGMSFFRERGLGGWWFRPANDHVRYWTNHSLPVILVMYHPETRKCHWQLIDGSTLVETLTGRLKVLVPERQVLDTSALEPLRAIAEGRHAPGIAREPRRPVKVSAGSAGSVWNRQRIPEDVRTQVISTVYRRLDEVGWDRLRHNQQTELLRAWVDDPTVGGVLTRYFPDHMLRVWLKDSLLKEYPRAKQGTGPYARYVTRRYQTPDEIVLAVCGDDWSVEPGTLSGRPTCCLATNGNSRRYVFWGDVREFKHLLFAALSSEEGEYLKPIVVLLRRESDSGVGSSRRAVDIAARAQIELRHLVLVETPISL